MKDETAIQASSSSPPIDRNRSHPSVIQRERRSRQNRRAAKAAHDERCLGLPNRQTVAAAHSPAPGVSKRQTTHRSRRDAASSRLSPACARRRSSSGGAVCAIFGPCRTENRDQSGRFGQARPSWVLSLRRKIEREPLNPEILLAEIGVGYRIAPPTNGPVRRPRDGLPDDPNEGLKPCLSIFSGLVEIAITLALVIAAARPIGAYMADVFQNRPTLLTPILGPIERAVYRAAGISAKEEQEWDAYAISMVVFGGACMLGLYAILRLQAWLPLNPQGFPGVPPDLAFNIAVSFVTNANWQAYSGETTLAI